MGVPYVLIFERTEKHIHTLEESEQVNIRAALHDLSLWKVNQDIKKLRGAIHELRFGAHRFIFFRHADFIYVIDGFRKKSQKTPKAILERSVEIYRLITK